MKGNELETRIAEATTEEAVRQLIADFKTYKDGQISELTGQLNAAAAEQATVLRLYEERAATAESVNASLRMSLEEAARALAEKSSELSAKDAELLSQSEAHASDVANAVSQAKLEIQGRLDTLVTAAEEAFAPLEAAIDAGLSAPLAAVIAQARSYTTEARRLRLEAEIEAAEAAKASAGEKLASL